MSSQRPPTHALPRSPPPARPPAPTCDAKVVLPNDHSVPEGGAVPKGKHQLAAVGSRGGPVPAPATPKTRARRRARPGLPSPVLCSSGWAHSQACWTAPCALPAGCQACSPRPHGASAPPASPPHGAASQARLRLGHSSRPTAADGSERATRQGGVACFMPDKEGPQSPEPVPPSHPSSACPRTCGDTHTQTLTLQLETHPRPHPDGPWTSAPALSAHMRLPGGILGVLHLWGWLWTPTRGGPAC